MGEVTAATGRAGPIATERQPFWVARGSNEAAKLMDRLPLLDSRFSPSGIPDYQQTRMPGVGLTNHLLYALALCATGKTEEAKGVMKRVFLTTNNEAGFFDEATNTLNGEIGNASGFRTTSEQMMGVLAMSGLSLAGPKIIFGSTATPFEVERRITNYFIASENKTPQPLGDDRYLAPELWHILALGAIGRTTEAEIRMEAIVRSIEFVGSGFFKYCATTNQQTIHDVPTQLLATLALYETGNRLGTARMMETILQWGYNEGYFVSSVDHAGEPVSSQRQISTQLLGVLALNAVDVKI